MMRGLFLLVAILLSAAGCSGVEDLSRPLATDNEHLQLTGRFVKNSEQLQFTWPGSSISFRFNGRKASAVLTANERVRFALTLDGKTDDLWLKPGTHTYVLVQADTVAARTITLTRLTESFAIVTQLEGLPNIEGQWLAPPAPRLRKMLVIGDSISAGYGVEGQDQHCGYTHETSNQQLTYAAIAARALDADLHSIAWSGIGVWRSYGESVPVQPAMPLRSLRTLADAAAPLWDSQNFQPQVLLVNLGTNDFWQPDAAEYYRQHMHEFVQQLRLTYPAARLYLMASPMLGDPARAAQIKILQQMAQEQSVDFLDAGKIEASDGFGCDYHPNQITHTRLGKKVAERLRGDLNW